MQKKLGSSFPRKPAERGRVWSHCNYQVVAEECNYQTQWLENIMLRYLLNTWHNCIPWQRIRSMKSADQIGHIKFLPWGQLDGCSMTMQTLLLCEVCGLQDYSLRWWCECMVTSHNTLASLCVGGKEGYTLTEWNSYYSDMVKMQKSRKSMLHNLTRP